VSHVYSSLEHSASPGRYNDRACTVSNAMATDSLCARPALLPPGWLPARNFPDVVCQEKYI
jgi:hypothetical protein